MLDHFNICSEIPEAGDVLVINRKVDVIDDFEKRILCKVVKVVQGSNSKEVIISSKNDYFIWDMYMEGSSWVWRVWNLGKVDITDITNTFQKFPRR